MASTCISICVNDARAPVRATYINLYKWPESDFEFVRSMSSNNNLPKGKNRDNQNNNSKYSMHGHPRVVDSYSCRQLYLRSYTFSREEDHRRDDDEEERSTIKCLGKKVVDAECNDERGCDHVGKRQRRRRTKKSLKRAKAMSCSVVESIFRGLLSCTTKVDVVN